MGTTTRAIIRQRMAEAGGWWWTGTTTSAGDSASLIDTGLKNLLGGTDTDGIAEKYALLTTGAAATKVGRITAYDGASDATIVDVGATTGSGVTYEIHDYLVDDIHAAIDTACRKVFPDIYVPIVDETIVVDNLLLNSDFETYDASADPDFANWVLKASPTVATESSIKIHGSQSLKVTALDLSAGLPEGVEQDLVNSIHIRDLVGKTLHVRGWIYASDASAPPRIRVSFNGTTFTDGAYHSGANEWEYMTDLNVTIPAAATEIVISLEAASATVVYFDAMSAWITPLYRYTVPTSIIQGPTHIEYQEDVTNPESLWHEVEGWHTYDDGAATRYLVLDTPPLPGTRLRIYGKGYLTVPTVDASTIEVSEGQVDVIAHLALAELYERVANVSASADGNDYFERAQRQKAMGMEALRRPGVRRRDGAQLRYREVLL